MAKAMYVGIGGVARKVKNGYLGVGSHKVRQAGVSRSQWCRQIFLYDFGTASVHLSPASADTDASSYTMTRGYGTLSLRLVTTMGAVAAVATMVSFTPVCLIRLVLLLVARSFQSPSAVCQAMMRCTGCPL